MNLRILFASVHSYIDPSSGAALATRDLLEPLAARGADCRAIGTGVLDYEQDTPLATVVAGLGVPYDRADATLSNGDPIEVLDFELNGATVTLLPTHTSRGGLAPNLVEARAFVDLVEQVFKSFRPHVLLTYGGHPACLHLIQRARRRGIATVFHLHNFAYTDRRAFADCSAVLVPTEFARRLYERRLGLDCVVLPLPVRPERILAEDPEPTYVTFVNPQPAKGAPVFARIASELHQRRPDIPFLVVEGRARAPGLADMGLDLSGLANLNFMPNTPDPRQFYRVSRAVLVPSLVENAALVAREALANGLPVLASDRGALPETLGDAGFLFALPDHCTTENPVVPTPREVRPWVATLERLWDDPAFEPRHRERARAEAQRWEPNRVIDSYVELFDRLAGMRTATVEVPPPAQETVGCVESSTTHQTDTIHSSQQAVGCVESSTTHQIERA
jgi:glycosyltransferase involved in cell wall biosynthesis